MNHYLYHGSIVPNIKVLETRSKLHHTNQQIVYLTSSIPYALVYIWDSKKNSSNKKHVTCGIRNGVVFYEEKFPNQLETFYKGVSGYLYCVNCENTYPVHNREFMYYSLDNKLVIKTIFIEDVYEELLKYEALGVFKVYRYNEQTEEKKNEFKLMNAYYLIKSEFFKNNHEQIQFWKKYYRESWNLALDEKDNPEFIRKIEKLFKLK